MPFAKAREIKTKPNQNSNNISSLPFPDTGFVGVYCGPGGQTQGLYTPQRGTLPVERHP